MTQNSPRWRLSGHSSLVLLSTGLFVAWLLAKPGTHATFVFGDNLLQGLLELVGVLVALPLGMRRRPARDEDSMPRQPGGWAPTLIVLGILSYALGQAIWTLNEDILHLAVLFPSWADAAWLGSYPLVLLGILTLPTRPLALATRTRVVLDGLLLLAGAVTFSWYFLLGPTVLQDGENLVTKLVSTAYPFATLLLVACLLLLAASARESALRGVVALLVLGLSIVTVTDVIYGYQELHNAYATGSLLDVGWPLGYMLVGLGARRLWQGASATGLRPQPDSSATVLPALWRSLLPYACLPAVGALLVYMWRSGGHGPLEAGVLVGTAVLVLLVIVRQIVALRELHMMYLSNDALTAANQQLEVLATTDALTALPNRIVLQERLSHALRLAQRAQQPLALLLMDLDRFKEVNDTLGHPSGDQLLQQIGPRVQGLLRGSDTVARLGGDEFAVLLPTADLAGALGVARAILRALESPFRIEGHMVDVGASVGVALHPAHGGDADTLLRCADVAMYVAKRTHQGTVVYDPAQDQHTARRLGLMSDLRQALADDALRLHYQPKVERASGRLIGAEVLLRWPHPKLGLVPPDQFIPLAEHTGLIAPITQWVLETALRQGQIWRRQGRHLPLAVNLSAHMLHDLGLPALVGDLVHRHECPAGELTLEITESALMIDPGRALTVVTQLADLGVHISIDDFGTGYSSLGYLQGLPVNEIKIDKSFVLDMEGHTKKTALVGSIITMAHALGLEVVAEGVETADAWDLLQQLGCDMVQGYYMSRPLPPEELEAWMTASPWGQDLVAPEERATA
ncbi:MAG TPA: EAL domain-containing protein [Chloroflexota bacterium]|nr:EAL domain-containing protein [Chloroflexota bacterium]